MAPATPATDVGSSEWDQLYLDCACNDNFDKVLKIKENDDLISDARSQMVELAVRNRAFLERASRPTKREMKANAGKHELP